MNIEALVAVSGMSGIHKVVGTRNNGLIIEDLDNGKRKFVPSRTHQFSPLESISIYTYTDATPLKEVFTSMKTQLETNPPVSANATNQELIDYFRVILADFDEEKVKVSDIKKVIKWFNFLQERGYLEPSLEGGDEEE